MADLVSSQVLQKTLDELRNITRIDLCVTNTDGVLLVTTFPETAIDAESIRSLSRTFFSTIFFWWMSTTARKSFASTQMCAALFTW